MAEIDLISASRHERKRKKLQGDHCLACGEKDIRCLESVTLCAECRRKIQGLPTVENHHVMGRKLDPLTVPLSANEHAIVSDLAIDYPGNKSSTKKLYLLHALSAILNRLIEMVEAEIRPREGEK